jgi:NTP pyrophosphatase (non-canonical NTP hydrolase)
MKSINEISHQEMVALLIKPGEQILKEMTPSDAHLTHMAIGVSGEAGELLDAIKKAVIYRKPLDRINIIEELGDIEFYLQAIREELLITREETLEANKQKLSIRYSKLSFSNEDAQNRNDKTVTI